MLETQITLGLIGGGIKIVENPHLYKLIQNRKHSKKRINKKWGKRYGFRKLIEPHGYLAGDTLYCHPSVAEAIRQKLHRLNR